MDVTLDGRSIDSREALHHALARSLHFPVWYGKNLDALHDCLTALPGPVTLRILHARQLRKALGGYASSFGHVLHDSERENENLTVIWEE